MMFADTPVHIRQFNLFFSSISQIPYAISQNG